MKKTTLRRKPFVVDDRRYEVSITSISDYADDPVTLRITIRADFGYRSFCTIRGLQNFDYWRNYGYWSKPEYSEATDTISVTPSVIAELIRLAHQRGWAPSDSKSNHEIQIDNAEAKALMSARDGEKLTHSTPVR